MHKDIAVKIQNVSKIYKLYNKPIDRVKEALNPFKKSYHKDFYALKNINLEIKKGEVLGIVGVNGAGKSTLLKIITGVLTPTSGRITVNGKLNAILELGSGLKPEMTGRENIKLNLQINGINKDRETLTQEIIDFADIGEHINQPIKTYSSGMRARLGFGIATSTDPDILIVDEVLAVGDVLFQRKCYGKIEKLFKDGKTVIFVSHNTQSVIEFCSRAVLLYDREIILDDTPKKVTDFYQKLVFSNNKQKVIDEISKKRLYIVKEDKNKNIKKEPLENKKFYLQDFKSKPIEYRNYNVDIFNIKILDIHGKKVNILQTHHTYSYKYSVRFHDAYKNVIFGTQFKTVKGQNLSSINSNFHKNKLISVQKNEIYLIEIKFICILIHGHYFLNAGVATECNGENIFLNRLVDAYLFKIEKDIDLNIGGIINQNYNISIKSQS